MFTQYEWKYNEEKTVCGIPFKVFRNGETGRIETLPRGHRIEFPGKYEALFFLGMTTTNWHGSEWWGVREIEYNLSERTFVGSRMAHCEIVYTDNTEENFDFIFGVNCWNYYQYCEPQPYEPKECAAPFDEPFKSDPAAMALFQKSLRLMDNDSPDREAGTRWVFGMKIDPEKTVRYIQLGSFKVENHHIFLSGVTGLNAGEAVDPSWRMMTPLDFIQKSWYADADRLMRRLYTFRDSMPKSVPIEEVEGFCAPDIRFFGSASAEIYTNVYRVNITDMANNKIEENGQMNTSSRETYNFGDYGGIGLFKKAPSYYGELVSRDVGRTLTELVNLGYSERELRAVDRLEEYLYSDPGEMCPVPHWKRVADRPPHESHAKERIGEAAWENDGHGSLMMFLYSLWHKGAVDRAWLEKYGKMLIDAGEYVMWQIENPKKSHFKDVTYSFSEATTFFYGGYDLYSNILVAAGLEGFSRMMRAMDKEEYAERFHGGAAQIFSGVEKVFAMQHPRFGEVFSETINIGWTYNYKRFAMTFMYSDLMGYDMAADYPRLYEKLVRTFMAQKDDYYYSPFSGAQMGYGQGYLTVAALMLDRYEEFTDCMDAIAEECYHPYDLCYMVPEGVILHGSGKYWFRQKDLGNGVQQAETVKCARLLLGIDDLHDKSALRLIPRLPDRWTKLEAKGYPVSLNGGVTKMDFTYERATEKPENAAVYASDGVKGYAAAWSGAIPVKYIRMGPFESDRIEVEGGRVQKIEKLNDRWFASVVPG